MIDAIIGISAFYHDSAAVLIENGKIVAAAQEERFTRLKHDDSFPVNAIKYVLSESSLSPDQLNNIAFYDKPYLKLERLLETYHAFAPKGLNSFLSAIPVWIKEKLFMKKMLRDELGKLGFKRNIRLLFPEHHLSHAASAFYPSPFDDAAILTIDGVGEWATTTIGIGNGNKISILKELSFPHSLGLLYSAFTYYTGFRVNSGEYKLMGLAPYGIPGSEQVERFKTVIKEFLIDIREDGSLLLNMKYFNFATGLRMVYDKKWTKLLGIPPRKSESDLTQPYMDLALAIQQITEEIIFKLIKTTKEITGKNNLVIAGGVGLNSVANGKMVKEKIFDSVWIQPAAGDAGGAIGAALSVWHILMNKEKIKESDYDEMNGAFLGPEYFDNEILQIINKYDIKAAYFDDFGNLTEKTALLLSEKNVVGWFQGRMEFGPRALGNRSILGDARDPEMQKRMNLKIKYREGFRPFAPSVPEEDMSQYFNVDDVSPYMLLVVPVNDKIRKSIPSGYYQLPMYERLYIERSEIPAVTHIDFSARYQSVSRKTNSKYWELIQSFKKLTGCSVLINTSFNVRGEPIVCTPDDAVRCFMRTEMDCLVIGNFLINKNEQGKEKIKQFYSEKFDLD